MKLFVSDRSQREFGSENYLNHEYLYVLVNDMIVVQIKKEYEGVVVDLYPNHVVDEPIDTTYAMWGDVPNYKGETKEEMFQDFDVVDVLGNAYGTENFHAKELTRDILCVKVKNLSVQLEYDNSKNRIIVNIFPNGEDKSIASTKAYLKQFVTK